MCQHCSPQKTFIMEIASVVNKSLARQIDIDFEKVDEKMRQMVIAHADNIFENQKDEYNSNAAIYTEAVSRTFVDIFSDPDLSEIERLYYTFYAGSYYQAIMTALERMADLKGLSELLGKFLGQEDSEDE